MKTVCHAKDPALCRKHGNRKDLELKKLKTKMEGWKPASFYVHGLALIERVSDETLISDPAIDALWETSPYRRAYMNQSPKKRGTFGESLFKAALEKEGISFTKADSAHYDLMTKQRKIEIKTNLSNYSADGQLQLNMMQIRPAQTYDTLIAQIITPDGVRYFMFAKKDILKLIKDKVATPQHGGKKDRGKNVDTYIINGKYSRFPALKPYEISFSDMIKKLKEEDETKNESA